MIINYYQHFKPTQGEKFWPDLVLKNVIYREYLPCKELQTYVACYWTTTSVDVIKEPLIDRVIPDGCMDIIFNLENTSVDRGGFVVGLMNSPAVKSIKGVRNFLGVRFWPGGAIPFLNYSAADFTDEIVPLEFFWKEEALTIHERICSENRPEERVKIVENKLISFKDKIDKDDQLISYTLQEIFKHKGVISIENLAGELGISQRHLSRKFKDWIGTNPKKFCNIIRFQNIINHLNQKEDVNWLEIALLTGYYDQSHLIREFKSFYGQTPSQLVD